MAKKPTRKMPADVKRTLSDRRTQKQTARRAQAVEVMDESLETVHVRLPDYIDAERFKAHLESPEGSRALADFALGLFPMNAGAEPSRDPAEVADNAAVDLFAEAMRERLAQKRAQGYGGWNDPTQCDARKIARLFMDKLFGTADGEDLGNYLAFLHHFGHGGQYALREVVKDHVKALNASASADAARVREQLAVANKELEHARDVARRAEANLARAMGYIDRVTEGEPLVAGAQYREERHRVGNLEHVQIEGARRGPQLDLGSPYANHDDFMTRR